MCDNCGHGKAGAQHPQVIPSPGSQRQLWGQLHWCHRTSWETISGTTGWMVPSLLVAVADSLSPLISGRAGFANIPSVCAGTQEPYQ